MLAREYKAKGGGYTTKKASAKDLKVIAKELLNASKMHKGQSERITNLVKSMDKKASVEYRGHTFPGYNKPMKSWRPGKKKVVLAKKGDKVKVVHFGATGYGHNYSAAARKSYLARSAKIKGVNDKFSANYWARKVLWAGKGGSVKSNPKGRKGKYASLKSYFSGKEGFLPGDQTALKANISKGVSTARTNISKGIADTKAYLKPRLDKARAYAKDYMSGNQGYLPGDQSGIKANISKAYDKVKGVSLSDIRTHLTQKGNSPLLKKKKKKKPVEAPKVYEI